MEKKRSPLLVAKITLDVVMALLLLMLYQKRTISMGFHEVGGLVVFGMFLVHNLLNLRWIKSVALKLFKKDTGCRLRARWILNALLFVTMSGIILTGLMMSKTIPIKIGNWFGARQWHYFLSAISIILMGIHLGIHWNFIKKISPKASFVPKKVSSVVGVLVLVLALVWGSYSLFAGSFGRWISGPFTVSSFSGMNDFGRRGMGTKMEGSERTDFGKDFSEFMKDRETGEKIGEGKFRGEFGERVPFEEAEEREMRPGMRQGMGQGMRPGMRPGMGQGMKPGMRPGMGQGMNPGMQDNGEPKTELTPDAGVRPEADVKPEAEAKPDADAKPEIEKGFRQKDGMPKRQGRNMGQKASLLNILKVIATYAAEMIVFAFITVLILGYRKQ